MTKSVWESDLIPSFFSRSDFLGVVGFFRDPIPTSVMYSSPPPKDSLKDLHPATFAESDVEKLIRFFTKKSDKVLDPFLGSGSTLVACASTGRSGIGIELVPKWAVIASRRVKLALKNRDSVRGKPAVYSGNCVTTSKKTPFYAILEGDARDLLKRIPDESIDFIVTSPPYWNILSKPPDRKLNETRISKGLPVKYSENNPRDLANIPDYFDFLTELSKIFRDCKRVLKTQKYICVIVSDFRHGPNFVAYHSDLASELSKIGLSLQGIIILVQRRKHLYPYGIPFSFVPNVQHQYALIYRRTT